jgi:hypothetical protein
MDILKEKIVQQAICIILNVIYEASFLNLLHNSYLDDSICKVFNEIKHKFQDVK